MASPFHCCNPKYWDWKPLNLSFFLVTKNLQMWREKRMKILKCSFCFCKVDIRVRVKGGGTTSQIYAIRQAIAKGIVAYYQKCKIIYLFFDNYWCLLQSLMKRQRKRLKIFWCNMTEPCWSQIHEDVSRRNSEVQVPVLVIRNRTVNVKVTLLLVMNRVP